MEFIFPVIFWKSFLPIPILTFGAVMVLLFDIFASDEKRKATLWLSIAVPQSLLPRTPASAL